MREKILPIILILLLSACSQKAADESLVNTVDTVTVKIGKGHDEPTPKEKSAIYLNDCKTGERIWHFYSDSIYNLNPANGTGIRFKVESLSEFVTTEMTDSSFVMRTSNLPDSVEKIKFKLLFRADTTRNIVLYHYMVYSSGDYLVLQDFKREIDTVAIIQTNLHNKSELNRKSP